MSLSRSQASGSLTPEGVSMKVKEFQKDGDRFKAALVQVTQDEVEETKQFAARYNLNVSFVEAKSLFSKKLYALIEEKPFTRTAKAQAAFETLYDAA
jgi:peroxiredoxin